MIGVHYATAQQVATKMEKAAQALEQAMLKEITQAEQTNLTVHQHALNTNKGAITACKSFQQHFKQTIVNIQSVATEFKRVDKEVSTSLDKSDIRKDTQIHTKLR